MLRRFGKLHAVVFSATLSDAVDTGNCKQQYWQVLCLYPAECLWFWCKCQHIKMQRWQASQLSPRVNVLLYVTAARNIYSYAHQFCRTVCLYSNHDMQDPPRIAFADEAVQLQAPDHHWLSQVACGLPAGKLLPHDVLHSAA